MKKNTRLVVGMAALAALAAYAIPAQLGGDVQVKPDVRADFTIERKAGDAHNLKVADNVATKRGAQAQTLKLDVDKHANGPIRVVSRAYGDNPVTPPYTEGFANAAAVAEWKIIDANGDNKPWMLSSGSMRIAYNSSKAMDDWLISPPLQLEGGKMYTITLSAWAQSATYPERLEVMAGKDATVAAMTETVIEPTVINGTSRSKQTLTGTLVADADGLYYVGIHGISDPDTYYLFVDDFSVSAGVEASFPAKPTDVKFAADYDGAVKTTITFNAPTTTATGAALTELTKIEIKRGNTVVKTFDAPAVGAALSYVDEPATAGTYSYSIVAYNADGAGLAYTKSVYVGLNYAAAPTNVKITEFANEPGKVTLSWDAPTKDIEGNDINPALVSYYVLEPSGTNLYILAQDVTECEFVIDEAVAPGTQDFVEYAVLSADDRGYDLTTGLAYSDMAAVGTPYNMPVIEKFDGGLEYMLGTSSDDEDGWGLVDSTMDYDVDPKAEPVDGTAAMLMWWPNVGDTSTLFTGKVHVDESEYSEVGFYYHTNAVDAYTIMPYVMLAGNEYDLLDAPIHTGAAAGEEPEWKQAKISLVDYVGCDVQIGWRFECLDDAALLLFDKYEIKQFCDYDLGVNSITAPRSVEVGETATISAVIENYGTNDVASYQAQLLCNGEVVDTQDMEALAVGETATVTFTTEPFDVFADIMYTYQVKVVWTDDQNELNNESTNAMVIVSQTMMPTIDTLEGTLNEEAMTVALTWEAPETYIGVGGEAIEDFESAEPFATEVDGWTIIDGDGKTVGGINGVELPNTSVGWFVFDASGDSFNASFDAHSGTKYMSTMYNNDGSKQDDWMISPELSGEAQTISFWGRTYGNYGLETIEVLYSTTDKATASFTSLGTKQLPSAWTEFEYNLPEGALYFAIRCVSQDIFMSFIDDVHYQGAKEDDATPATYNVYRNNELIADGLTTTEYTDEALDYNTEYTYYVTTVYSNDKESPLSNPVEITTPLAVVESLTALSDMPEDYHFIMGCPLTVIYSSDQIAIVTDGESNAALAVEEAYAPGDVLATGWEAVTTPGLVNLACADEEAPAIVDQVEPIEPAPCEADDIANQQAKDFNFVYVPGVKITADAIEDSFDVDGNVVVGAIGDEQIVIANYLGVEMPDIQGTYTVTGFWTKNPSGVAPLTTDGDTDMGANYILIPTDFEQTFETVHNLTALSDLDEFEQFIMGCNLTVIYANEYLAVVTDGESNGLMWIDIEMEPGDIIAGGYKAINYGDGILGFSYLDEPEIAGQGDIIEPTECTSEDIADLQRMNLNYCTIMGLLIDQESLDEYEENEGLAMITYCDEFPVLLVNYFEAEFPDATGKYDVTGFWVAESGAMMMDEDETPSMQYYFIPISFKFAGDAIQAIDADNNGNAVYYDLRGIKIANPRNGNAYIRVIDGKAVKVINK